MTPTTNDGPRPAARRKSWIKWIVIGVPAALVVLVLVVILAGPAIASAVAPGIIASAARDSIKGEVTVSDVSLSWRGPQRVGSLVLTDPTGKTVVDISASADAGLLGLARGSMNLGTVRLSGLVDIVAQSDGSTDLERALERRPAPVGPPMRPGVPAPPTPSAPQPVRLPGNLAMELDVRNLDIRFTGPMGGGVQTVGLKDITATGSFANARPVSLRVSATTLEGEPAIAAQFNADRLTSADGTLAMDTATIDGTIDASLPARYVELIVGSLLGVAPEPGSPASAGEPLRVVADVVSRNGRLVLADPSRPAFVQWRLPEALMAGINNGDAYVTLDRRPLMSVALSELNVPLPGPDGTVDLRGAAARIVAHSEALAGVMGLHAGDAPRAFRIDPFSLNAGTGDFASGIGITGEITSSYEGTSTGSMKLDVVVGEFLDDAGMPRAGRPGVLRGGVSATSLPTALIQPFLQDSGMDLAELLGPVVAMDVKVGMLEAREMPAGINPREGGLYLAGEMQSDRTSAWVNVFLDTGGVRSRGKGIQVQSDAVGYLLTRFLGDSGVEVGGKPGLVLDMERFDIPLDADQRPVLGKLSANAQLDIGEITLRPPPGPDGRRTTIEIESLNSMLTLEPGKPGALALDYRARADGLPFGVTGAISIAGLSEALAAAAEGKAFDPSGIKPSGTIRASKVPTSLASLASSDARRIAEAAIGPALDLVIETTPGEGVGASRLALTLESERAGATGAILLDRTSVKTGPGGIVATLQRPGDVLAAMNPPTPDGLIVAVEGRTPLRLTVSDLVVPMGDADASAMGPTGRIRAEGGAIGVTIRGDDGQPQRIDVKMLDVSVASMDRGEAELKLNITGDHAGAEFGLTGGLTASGLKEALAWADTPDRTIEPGGAKSPDSEGIELPLDLRKLKLTGAIKAERVPTALVSVVDSSNGALVREALGPTLDLDITAREARMPALDMRLASRHLTATTAAVVSDGAVAIGPTKAGATVRPAVVAQLLADPQAGGAAPLTLDQPTQLQLTAAAVDVPLRDGRVLRPAAIGALDVAVKADQDILLTAPGKDGAPAQSLGVRDLALTAQVDPTGAGKVQMMANAFDPRDAATMLANVNGDIGLPFGQRPFKLDVNAQDTARIDRVLATDGLLGAAVGSNVTISAEGLQGAGAAGAAGAMTISARVASPKLTGAARLTRSTEGLRLLEPASVDWEIDPVLLDRYVFAPEPVERLARPSPLAPMLTQDQLQQMPKEQRRAYRAQRAVDEERYAEQVAAFEAASKRAARGPVIRAAAPLDTTLRIDRLSTGHEDRPFDPAVFKLGMTVAIKQVSLRTADGVPIDLGAVTGTLGSIDGAARAGVRFDLRGEGAAGDSAGRFNTQGSIADLADASGVLSTNTARITSTTTGDLPTMLLDALGEQDGSLVALLGPRVNADVRTTELSRTGGDLSAQFTSANARASLSGSIADDVLTLKDGATVQVSRITPEFTSRFVRTAIPIIDRVDKTEAQRPSVVTANGLTIPLNGDTRALNGVVRVDLGEVRFQAASFFGRIFNATGGRSFGTIGRRIEPFDVRLTRGVARYDRITIPAGEFNIDTRGKVNLNDNTMDIVVFVPASAVASEVAVLAGRVPGFNQVATLPLRFRGPTGDPSMEIDFESMIEDLPGTILQTPGNVVEGVGGILGGILGGGRRNDSGGSASPGAGNAVPQERSSPAPAPAPEPKAPAPVTDKDAKEAEKKQKKEEEKQRKQEEKQKKQDEKQQKKDGDKKK